MRRILLSLQTIDRLKARYFKLHGRLPRLFRPRRFTEKMQWRKLFDRNELFTLFCDKLATRERIAARIGAEYLAPLLWSGGADEIPFERLTPPYFLKSSHAAGQVMCVTAALAQDVQAVRARAADWLRICFFEVNGEPGYRGVPRRLIAEQALLAEDGGPPQERRLFVFDGKVGVINTVFVEDGVVRNGAFHTPDWKRLDWYFTRQVTQEFPPPKRLADMIRIAELLGQSVDQVRVDIFDCGDRIYAGELTAYSWSGMAHFHPDEADVLLGRYWRLRWPLLRALAAILFWADRPWWHPAD